MSTFNATPARLRDQSWGARVRGCPAVGDTLTITARSSGKTWQVEVASIVWSGADHHTGEQIALVRTRDLPKRQPATTRSSKPARYPRRADATGVAYDRAPAPKYTPAEGEVCRSLGCLGAPDSDGLCPRCADLRDAAAAPCVDLSGCPTLDESYGGDPWADESHPLHAGVTGDDEPPATVWADDEGGW